MSRKKNAIRFVWTVVFVVLLVFVLFACGQKSEATNDPDDKKDDPTTPVVDHTEHEWEATVTFPGTCIAEGYTVETCAIGGETRIVSTGKLGDHEYSNHICRHCGDRERGEKSTDKNGVVTYGEYKFGNLTVYRYILTQTISGDKTYQLVVVADGVGELPDFASADECPWKTYNSLIRRVDILQGISRIGAHFADGMTALTTLNIGASVRSIGAYAFNGCESLTELTVGTSLSTVGERAFAGCEHLRNIELPASTTSVGVGAFAGCKELRSFSFGGHVLTGAVGEGDFFGSMFDVGTTEYEQEVTVEVDGESATVRFDLPDYLTKVYITGTADISPRFFENCGVVENVYVEGGVTTVCDRAFYGTTALKYISFDKNTLTTIGEEAFARSAALGAPKKDLEDEEASKKPQTIVFPDSLTSIGYGAFQSCGELVVVRLNGTYESIPDCAFTGCSKLTDITISDSVVSIGEEAFASTGLTSFKVGENVSHVGKNAFAGCSRLSTVAVDSLNVYRSSTDDRGQLFSSAQNVWVKDSVVKSDDEGIHEGTSYIKKNMTYRNYNKDNEAEAEYIGYHLWVKQ